MTLNAPFLLGLIFSFGSFSEVFSLFSSFSFVSLLLSALAASGVFVVSPEVEAAILYLSLSMMSFTFYTSTSSSIS
jgi:hypothetical protein